MAAVTTTAAKNDAIDGVVGDVTAMSLHTADPGAAGTSNEWSGGGYSRQTVSYDTAAAASADIDATASFTGTASTAVAYVGLWAGSTFKFHLSRESGDAAANAAGEYDVTSAELTAADLA